MQIRASPYNNKARGTSLAKEIFITKAGEGETQGDVTSRGARATERNDSIDSNRSSLTPLLLLPRRCAQHTLAPLRCVFSPRPLLSFFFSFSPPRLRLVLLITIRHDGTRPMVFVSGGHSSRV